MQEIKVRPGYKMTELGVIPEDWDLVRVGDSFKFKNGLNKEKEFFGYGTPIINYMDVYNFYGIKQENIKGKVFLTNNELKNFSIQKDDVLFTRTSETVEEIGISTVVTGDVKDTVFSGFVLRARPFNSLFSTEFKKYCFGTSLARNQIISKSTYTTRALTNGRVLSDIKIPLPRNIDEQDTIAKSINDILDLIKSLDELIDKKENIKDGAMQELLTGKRRLPGFNGEWEKKKLEKTFTNITTGKLDANAMVKNGKFRFYTCAKEHYYIDNYIYDEEVLLISGNGENVGYVHYFNGKFNAYQRTYILLGFKDYIFFIKYYLDKYLKDRIFVEAKLGSTPYITKDTLTDMIVNVPTDIEEQKAIAEVLSDMDNEIEALKTKRDKYKQIKDGMMQELLTGKIRLV